jgi:hypothetical protein
MPILMVWPAAILAQPKLSVLHAAGAVLAAGEQLANAMATITTKNNTKRLDIFSSLKCEKINQQIIVAGSNLQ